ncbi:hypothetical protein BpHYR1_041835 [Brachionus plicatilis]|uniref:Uncharacterized protein n=1 Tax=Brachionus plicatilis TaxID=10195 RepID=A0A3M7Q2P5_BRAPC|nr:hypothetical protein BpHYR1_041835 [Brachionus plicatilis]
MDTLDSTQDQSVRYYNSQSNPTRSNNPQSNRPSPYSIPQRNTPQIQTNLTISDNTYSQNYNMNFPHLLTQQDQTPNLNYDPNGQPQPTNQTIRNLRPQIPNTTHQNTLENSSSNYNNYATFTSLFNNNNYQMNQPTTENRLQKSFSHQEQKQIFTLKFKSNKEFPSNFKNYFTLEDELKQLKPKIDVTVAFINMKNELVIKTDNPNHIEALTNWPPNAFHHGLQQIINQSKHYIALHNVDLDFDVT